MKEDTPDRFVACIGIESKHPLDTWKRQHGRIEQDFKEVFECG
jgi:hypothetical protein